MAMPKVLDWLDDLVAKVATNTTNIANNKKTIEENKKLFDTHVADDNRHWTTTDRQNFDRVVHFKGYYTTIEKLKEAYPVGQLGDYAIVGATDTVWLWDDETNSWLNSTEQGIVISVNGRTGEVILTKTDVGLSNVDNTSDKNKPLSTAAKNALSAKADRKKITLDEADGVSLRAGIYDLYNIEKKILNFTSKYWTVIVGEQEIKTKALYGDINGDGVIDRADVDLLSEFLAGTKTPTEAQKILGDLYQDGKINVKDYNRLADYVINGAASDIIGTAVDTTDAEIKPATQIWMNYGNDEVSHIYVRHQVNGTSWSDFKEILTDVHFATLQNQITENAEHIATNTADISKLNINKANRGYITLDQANTLTGLQSGIYSVLDVNVTLAGDKYTNNRFNVIVCDWVNADTTIQGSQIWIPFSTDATTTAYIRHQKLDTDGTTRVWGDFIKIANQTQINNLQSQINTNKTNITNLTSDKADRRKVTIAELDKTGLRSGLYYCREQRTINGLTNSLWAVIVNEQNNGSQTFSASQIWINTDKNVGNRMFFRYIKDLPATWSDFTEVLTTDIASRDDIARFKQYKGYYATASDLKTALTTSSDGDYAIVGSALYIWNSKQSTWTEVSGSGGSTGTNKWSIKQYSVPEYQTSAGIPQFKHIIGKTLDRQWEIEDTTDFLLNESKNNYKCYLFETYVNMEEALEYSSTTLSHDDGINVFVNGVSIYSTGSTSSATKVTSLSIPVVAGWNKIQVLLCEKAGEEIFRLGIKFTSNAKCLGMDCYHAETEPVGGYVPLVGNSTIEGALTTTGNVVVGGDSNVNGNITSTGTITSGSDLTVNGKITSTGDIVSGGIVGVTSNAYLKYNADEKSISFIFN